MSDIVGHLEKVQDTLLTADATMTAQAAEITTLRAELADVEKAMGANAVRFMDPPDGGDPTLAEMVANMRLQLDAAEAELAAAKERAEAFKLTVASLKNQLTAESERAGRLNAALREGALQSLVDQQQAEEAWDAQKRAEAKAEGLAKALEELPTAIVALDWKARKDWTVDEQADRHGELQEMIAIALAAYRTDKEPGLGH